jgi:hypothetical protein
MTSDDEEGAEGEGRPPAPIRNIRSATGKTRVAATTALVDPEATKKVLLAAQAAGFEGLGQFLDFVCDSGLLATPPKDGITATFSLEDLGILRSRGFSTQNIAREFACEERVVRESWTRYADDLGAQVVGVRLTTIAGELQARAEHVTQLLMEGGKPEQAWKVQKEYTKLLQDLGVVDRAKREIHVTHSIDDQQKQELDKLLELKQKKLARQEEIKQIEVEVFDDVPQT